MVQRYLAAVVNNEPNGGAIVNCARVSMQSLMECGEYSLDET